jgi:FAD/FMN-containing dehydrogenase
MTIHAVPPLTDAPAQVLLAHLTERLGSAHVRSDADDIALHLREERGLYSGTALAVVRPGSTEEVAFVVRECAAAGHPHRSPGRQYRARRRGVPYGGIVLSLARLNRIREVDP